MNNYINSPEFIELYQILFKGRTDVIAEHWSYLDKNNSKKRSGYRPICLNRKVENVCPKKVNHSFQCKNCTTFIPAEMTQELLKKHFIGDAILGVYPLLLDNNCWFVAGDFDNHDGLHDPLSDIINLNEVCEVNEIPIYIFRSKSGNGFHVYMFFNEPVPSWKARLVLFTLIQEAGLAGDETKINVYDNDKELKPSSFDRLFPNQDKLNTEKSFGNLIALEFQGKAVIQGNTVLLDPETKFVEPYTDQLEALKKVVRVTESQLDKIIVEWKLEKSNKTPTNTSSSVPTSNSQFQKLLKCDFINWAYNHKEKVSEPLWRAGISNVVRISPGGFSLCHDFSKGIEDYNRQETENKARRAFDASNPITCSWIKQHGYNCGKECGVKSPAGLIHRKADSTTSSLHGADIKSSVEEILSSAKANPKELALKVLENPDYISLLSNIHEKDIKLFEETFLKLQSAGVKTKDISSIKKVIKSHIKQNKRPKVKSVDNEFKNVSIKDCLNETPADDQLIIPSGWKLSKEEGLIKIYSMDDLNGVIAQKHIIVSPSPILIVSRMVNSILKTEALELAWLRDNKWKHHVVDRKIVATARTITDLADVGLPVTNLNANDLVRYLAEFESKNIDALKKSVISETQGWQIDKSGFLLGEKFLSADLDSESKNIFFRARDEGNQQIANAICIKGSYEEWITIVNNLFHYPKAIAGVYFSLATPFLEILDAPNFVVDWSYGTSKGKTTILRIASSCWGNPDERSASPFLNTWDSTKYAIESTAGILNGLPLILDDTKLAGTGNQKDKASGLVSHIIYLVSNGRARGRGSPKGLRARGSWRTILLSSGEQPTVSFTQDGGSRARVITLWGPPFGSDNNAQLVRDINYTVRNNYGHAGQKIVKFIFDKKDEWDLWQKSYRQNQMEFGLKAGSNEIADRISDYFAVLATVIPLIHSALPELKNDPSVALIINNLWNTCLNEIDHADRPTAALRFIYNWAVSNQSKFWDKTDKSNDGVREPFGGWAGVWEKSKWNYIGFCTHTIKKVLEDEGFDFDGIIRTWKDREWLITSNKGRTKQHRIKEQHLTCYTLKKDAIISAIGKDLDIKPMNSGLSNFIKSIEEKLQQKIPENTSPGVLSLIEQGVDRVIHDYLDNPFESIPFNAPEFDLPFLKKSPIRRLD